jgi:plastocyanin
MTTRPTRKGTQSLGLLASLALLAACGRKEDAAPAVPPAAEQAAPTGKVIPIEMIADEKGSRYAPSEVTAHPGDVLRFTLTVGVHNVNFLPDSNPGVPKLPAPSEMLQLPGQTFDLTVNLPAGRTYYFQCDPHVALGMTGHLKVE